MKTRIVIDTNRGPHTIRALTRGPLALHWNDDAGKWVFTFIPNGMSFCTTDKHTCRDVRRMFRAFLRIDWTSYRAAIIEAQITGNKTHYEYRALIHECRQALAEYA